MFMFFDKNSISNLCEFYYLELGLYPYITDSAEAVKTLFQEKHNHSKNCITVEVSQKTQKLEICVTNERSGFSTFSTDQGHKIGSIVGNEFGVMLRRKNFTNQKLFTIFTHTLSHDIHGPD